jgi:hypothetical protein
MGMAAGIGNNTIPAAILIVKEEECTMWLRVKNELNCVIHGHIKHRITYSDAVYQYCPRCGRITWQHNHLASTHSIRETETVNCTSLMNKSLISVLEK